MRAGWIGALVLVAGQAEAGLTLCNDGGVPASVAIAYASDAGWVSEGWWGIEPGACAVVQSGDLQQQNYYYTLSSDGGFAGEGYSFCTQTKEFTLQGADGDCAGLDAESRAFSHIDTGADAADFTFRLAASPAAEGQTEAAPMADAPSGLGAAAIPSFERGLMGEPFVVNAVMQGCGPTNGGDGCVFYAEGVRWIAYGSGQSNPAALAAMAALPTGSPVLVSGDMIFFGDVTVEAAIASLEPGDDPFATTRAAMQGLWVSADDPQNRIEINGSEQTEIYAGAPQLVSLLTLSDFCGDAQGGVLLQVQEMGSDPADTQCMAVVSVDASRMELSYIGRGNTITFVRP